PTANPSASDHAATPPPVVVSSLGGRMTLITGLGGNIVLLGGSDGALVIDSGVPEAAEKTLATARKGGPISLLVNTHWHYDHVGGNEVFAESGARTLASANCRKRMSVEQNMEALEMKVPASAPRALPNVTFEQETMLHLNEDDIRLVPVAPAHTDGDVFVHFAKADVIHAGDLFFNGMFPFIDWSSGGWIGGMSAGVRSLVELAGPKTRIVPGHGPLAKTEDLKNYLGFLETMQERFEKEKAAGKSVDEVVAAAPVEKFEEKLGHGFLKGEQFVRITYTGLLKHA
ncbi:MAG: MBL fold metallo-hydrolase, partial [Chthoniobacterales bacterium]